jgi:hypothetical protein
MTSAVPRLQTAEAFGLDPFREQVARGMRDLFRPLEDLLISGGDPRLSLDPASGLNEYGCGPRPAPDDFSFASSTASVISERAYERTARAREDMMRSAISLGLEEAFDARFEAMREELKAQLDLAREVDVVFAPSGTDAQLQALFVAQTRLGSRLATIVVGSDQTGSGTAYTAHGRHFNSLTAAGCAVRKDEPVAGLTSEAIAVPLIDPQGEARDAADIDAAVLAAISHVAAGGAGVLLQVMDSSKLGWRAPGDGCLAEIIRRWPGKVQIVVDACQMRIGRGRLKAYLDRGYMVLITGSKYFGGPAFAGALLLPAALSRPFLKKSVKLAPGLADYTGRSDWPKAYKALRGRLESRANLGQWLRWEAALEEMTAYYAVPAAFRTQAVKALGRGIEDLIMLSPSLQAVPRPARTPVEEDEEFSDATIFPFTVRGPHGPIGAEKCRALYRALNRDMSKLVVTSAADSELAARSCLIGQPVKLERAGARPVAALRLCIGARLITDAWSGDAAAARRNLEHTLDRIAGVVGKIELLLAAAGAEFVES